MKSLDVKYEVRDCRWSSKSELKLPAWYKADNWMQGFEKLWFGSSGINKKSSRHNPSQIVESQKHLIEFLNQSANATLRRVILYIPISKIENSCFLWITILNTLNLEIPNWNQSLKLLNLRKNSEPHLAICLDLKHDNDISETTILIPHWESVGFLELCLWSIDQAFKLQSRPSVLVIDDGSCAETWEAVNKITQQYGFECQQVFREDARKVPDVGALLDIGLTKVSTKYVCMLDADTVVLKRDFLSLPLNILSSKQYISVGLDTGLGESYHSNQQLSGINTSVISGPVPPGFFSITNNLYRVMRTEDALAVSRAIGFSRAVADRKFRDQLGRIIRKIEFEIFKKNSKFVKNLLNTRSLNSRYPAMPPTCDNGVAANHWMDSNRSGSKFNIPITTYGAITPTDGVAFQNISDLLVHVALSTRALSTIRREIKNAGEDYMQEIRAIVNRTESLEVRFSNLVKFSQKFIFE
jgi:hypothetical protein